MLTFAAITDLSEAMRQLSWADLSPVLGLGVIGIGLWLAGRRFLRAGLALAGLMVGGAIGWIVAEIVDLGVSPWIFVGVGAVVLACFALLMFRFAVAGTLALVLALAAPTAVWTVGEWSGATDTSPTDLAETESDGLDPDEWAIEETADQGEGILEGVEPAAELVGVGEQAQKHIAALRGYTEWAIRKAEGLWAQTPENLRPEMVGAALAGFLAGLIIGTLAPKFSASVVTSFGGAMLILICLRIVAERLNAHEGWWMPGRATIWLVVWLATSLIGTAIQWTFRPKPADNSA